MSARTRGTTFVIAACLAGMTAPVQAQSCSQDHPGRQHRVESVTKRGDARMTRSVAGHITTYAIQRFELKGLVTDADIERARAKTYEFLKLRLGNPAAVAGQFVSAGYQHFDRGYSDEAAAALLGYDLPTENGGHSMFYLPPEIVDLWVMSEKLQNRGKAYLLHTFFGVPQALTAQILDAMVEEQAKVAKRMGFNIPKGYDFPNKLVLATAEAKRNPQLARAKFAAAVEDAARYESGAAAEPAGIQPRLPAAAAPRSRRP